MSLHPLGIGDDGAGMDRRPAPLVQPEYYDGVMLKRFLAYTVDTALIGSLLAVAYVVMLVAGLLTLGLTMPFLPLAAVFIPLGSHTLPIASRHQATLGMRLFGLHVEAWNGHPPNLLQAFIRTALFFVSVTISGSLALLVIPFNARRLALHDLLSGTVVLNKVDAI